MRERGGAGVELGAVAGMSGRRGPSGTRKPAPARSARPRRPARRAQQGPAAPGSNAPGRSAACRARMPGGGSAAGPGLHGAHAIEHRLFSHQRINFDFDHQHYSETLVQTRRAAPSRGRARSARRPAAGPAGGRARAAGRPAGRAAGPHPASAAPRAGRSGCGPSAPGKRGRPAPAGRASRVIASRRCSHAPRPNALFPTEVHTAGSLARRRPTCSHPLAARAAPRAPAPRAGRRTRRCATRGARSAAGPRRRSRACCGCKDIGLGEDEVRFRGGRSAAGSAHRSRVRCDGRRVVGGSAPEGAHEWAEVAQQPDLCISHGCAAAWRGGGGGTDDSGEVVCVCVGAAEASQPGVQLWCQHGAIPPLT